MRGVAALLACSTILRSRTAHRRTKVTRLNKKIVKLNEEMQRPKVLDVRRWPRRTGRYCSLIPMPARWRQAAGIIHDGSGAAYSDTVGFGLGIQQRRKLRMATGAPLLNDLLPSRVQATSAPTSCSIIASARSMPVVIPAEVHTGPSMMRIRSSSTLRFWEPNLQVTCAVPVRGRATAMEQTGFSQHERADAPSRRLAEIAPKPAA
jgi:hypothetical protein